MRAKTIVATALAAGLSFTGLAAVANAATEDHSVATIDVPGPGENDVAQGAFEAPRGGYWDIYSRTLPDGSHAGKEDAFNVIGLYLKLDPSQLHGPDKTADHVYGEYSCSQGQEHGTPRLAIVCDYEGGLPVVAFQQAG